MRIVSCPTDRYDEAAPAYRPSVAVAEYTTRSCEAEVRLDETEGADAADADEEVADWPAAVGTPATISPSARSTVVATRDVRAQPSGRSRPDGARRKRESIWDDWMMDGERMWKGVRAEPPEAVQMAVIARRPCTSRTPAR
jgi:hypothetical protein